ncbi:MAG: 4a-hydroxytetrahydrobiopterin dehydratase [Solirubrobacterales bacterium]|nr:4a-hydroxytetrahydrobiopterin dehydratase [Solirubrobacterales bacterium]
MSHDWQTQDGALVRERQFADFAAALAYVNAVGALAEDRGHHPDILLHGWNRVRLSLVTHEAGGAVTDADHALAAAIDALEP